MSNTRLRRENGRPERSRWIGSLIARLLLATLLLPALTQARAAETAKLAPRPFDSVLCRVVANLISTQHYHKKPLNDQISQQLFDQYFNTLDRDRRFFLASDIDEFSSYRNLLDNHIFEGNLTFAFDVYQRFRERVAERLEFTRQRLQEPFDFTIDEDIEVDRRNAPWCETRQELDELWRKQLKNRVLVFKLMAEAKPTDADADPQASTEPSEANEGEASDAADGQPAVAEAEDALPAPAPKSPVERVLSSQELFHHYLEENDSIDVVEMFLSSLTRIYDPHSSYMAPSTEEDFDINMKLSLQGIGAVLSVEDGYVRITELIDGGPAQRDGRLKSGDRIVAVAQQNAEPVDVIDMPLRKVVRLIRGAKGTTVILSVIEAGRALGSVPTLIDLVRDEVKLTDKAAKSNVRNLKLPDHAGIDGAGREAKVLILELPSFYSDFEGRRRGNEDYRSATRDIRLLLEQATAEQVEGVVLDLRSNGGGSLEEAIQLAGLFFTKGPVVQVKGTGLRREVHEDKDDAIIYDGPLVVLVNRMSASASEIVAAAIQDHHRGIIVGDASTHGKGTVQTVYGLDRLFARDPIFRNEPAGSLKFTIAKFYRINGDSTQLRGVLPDIVMPAFTDHMEIGEDKLDFGLRWDQIEALDFKRDVDITPYLPVVQQRANQRLATLPEAVEHRQSVDRYGEMKARKTVTLNLEKRRQLQQEEEKWLEKIRRQTFGDASLDDLDGQELDEPTPQPQQPAKNKRPDLVLDESLRVLADLIWLQNGDLLAIPQADAPEPANVVKNRPAAE